ncbi:alpha/beta hydrolase-fold protein [Cognatitamlana onchidii]|uniref:alpha/beta hydrolase-fold protein n=1 Tax=Cognatitamlana onchidii TaxID=2562860 RepID=UPI0010A61669|nr:alpha/beta hydrolase-fold protein [Algibacter onchidii]
MKNILFIVLSISINVSLIGQTLSQEVDSNKLGIQQSITIELPDSYNQDHAKKYPLILVLNSEYLFNPVIGLADYHAYVGEMPESIVVGIDKSNSKNIGDNNGKPHLVESDYYDFIVSDLLPYMHTHFKTNGFNVIIGDDNFTDLIVSFLFSESPVFQACVNLNPIVTPEVSKDLIERAKSHTNKVSYYMAASSIDSAPVNSTLKSTVEALENVENDYFSFNYDDFHNTSQHNVVLRGIPRALEKVFDKSQVIIGGANSFKVYGYEDSLGDE